MHTKCTPKDNNTITKLNKTNTKNIKGKESNAYRQTCEQK